jgi:hypothetical protein
VIERLQRTLLAAIGRPRPPLTTVANAIPRASHTSTRISSRTSSRTSTRTDVERRLDSARQRLKATIPPPPE